MIAVAPAPSTTSGACFPEFEIRRRLEAEVRSAADESVVLFGEWAPVLDSLRTVSILIALEDLFPFRIHPEKVIRSGGYSNVDEAVDDLIEKLRDQWNGWFDSRKPRVRT